MNKLEKSKQLAEMVKLFLQETGFKDEIKTKYYEDKFTVDILGQDKITSINLDVKEGISEFEYLQMACDIRNVTFKSY